MTKTTHHPEPKPLLSESLIPDSIQAQLNHSLAQVGLGHDFDAFDEVGDFVTEFVDKVKPLGEATLDTVYRASQPDRRCLFHCDRYYWRWTRSRI